MRAPGRRCDVPVVAAALLLSLAACTSTRPWDEQESWAGRSVGSYPYHPLVYHLDLSILAYQIHSQTFLWPFDPFYEQIGARRAAFLDTVRAWAREQGARGAVRDGLDAYRGPGVLAGYPDNARHDPILYRYAGLDPWSDAINNLDGRWLEMTTPKEITRRIGEAYVCYRPTLQSAIVLEQVGEDRQPEGAAAPDVLLAFEGGTGDKGDPGQVASRSILGFVLVRSKAQGGYDVHLAFRGSRSGSLKRSIQQAYSDAGGLWDVDAAGNPDWITDLGFDRGRFGYVSTTGEVHRGFAHATASLLPTAFRCLREVARIRGGAPPDSVTVTGHSLGGALAQQFVGAVLMGDWYGPGGAGPAMPDALRDWPWRQVKLITYGAPRVGDARFARALTEEGLQSDFFTSLLNPQDRDALPPGDPRIVARLLDPLRPAGYRVLITRDLVSTGKGSAGKHVGKTVYVNRPSVGEYLRLEPTTHDPEKLRAGLLEALADPRTPPVAWSYHDMAELNPERDERDAASLAELRKCADAYERACTARGIRFDRAAYARAVELRFELEQAE